MIHRLTQFQRRQLSSCQH